MKAFVSKIKDKVPPDQVQPQKSITILENTVRSATENNIYLKKEDLGVVIKLPYKQGDHNSHFKNKQSVPMNRLCVS